MLLYKKRMQITTRRFVQNASVSVIIAALMLMFTMAVFSSSAPFVINLDGQDTGRRFDGIGAVSAGASSRLLYDYPEPERSQILDYLFKPGYGAGIQLLKVEIGSETNATDGAEPTHMRNRDERVCSRGYEWWLMKEAKKRNPEIQLLGLEWGTPGWFNGGFWSSDNIDYLMSWLDCASEQGLKINYLGGWNERGYNSDWLIALDQALAKRYPEVRLIAADEDTENIRWAIADSMRVSPRLQEAVDVIGVHFACGHRTEYQQCASTPTAKALNKPIWMSENSALAHDVGAAPIARALNRMYVDAAITGYMSWSLISAWYANLPLADTGLILAEWPWSGYYQVGTSVWAYAHTTQFVSPGWRYLDHGSGRLGTGGSFVSLVSPELDAFTTVIETLDMLSPITIQLNVTGGLPRGIVHVWESDLTSIEETSYFTNSLDVALGEDSNLVLTLQPNHLYTLSTTSGQRKGDEKSSARIHVEQSLPFNEDFEGMSSGNLARFFSDLNGSFETTSCTGGREGMCYRQQTNMQPTRWGGSGNMDPTTIFGDPRWWGDYEVRAKFSLEEAGYIEIIGRVASVLESVSGYHLRIASDGAWSLYSEDFHAGKRTLAEGKTSVGIGNWHAAALRMKGTNIAFVLDGTRIAEVNDNQQISGNAGLRVSAWHNVQFDDIEVLPTGPAPLTVPKGQVTVTATSEHGLYRGYTNEAAHASDDRPETLWHTAFNPRVPLPQAITLDLGQVYPVEALLAQPRLDNTANGAITRYNVFTSVDGVTYTKVASGTSPISKATKVISFTGDVQARFIKLEALTSVNNVVSLGELSVVIRR